MLSPNIIPPSLTDFTKPFDDLFSHNQYGHFQEYLSGLIIGEGKNILDISHFIDLYDHSESRYLNYAHCLVQLSYIDARGIGYPLKTELYIKENILDEKDVFKTKNEIAKKLVVWAKDKDILFQGVLFDGWYLNDNLTECIENMGKYKQDSIK